MSDIMMGGASRANWDQTDPKAPDFIKNKPFYTTKSMGFVEIMSTISKQSTSIDSNTYFVDFSYAETKAKEFNRDLSDNPFFIEGVRYKVVINGLEYITTARYDGVMSKKVIIGGNFDYDGRYITFKDDPFIIVPGRNNAAYISLSIPIGDGNVENGPKITVAIYEEQEVESVKTIDPKFVEPGYFRINVAKDGDVYSLVDVTGFEIQAAWESGKMLYAVVHRTDATGVFDDIYSFSYYNGQVGKYVDLVKFIVSATELTARKLRISWDLYPDKVVYTECVYTPTTT